MLSSISVYAAQNPHVNVPLHLTGHDQEGNTFWLLTLPWWPRMSAHDVWPIAVVVDNRVLAMVFPRYEVTHGSVTVTLERWLTKRDDPPTKRVANILLLAAMEPTATEALKT